MVEGWEEQKRVRLFGDLPIEKLGLPRRAVNALRKGIRLIDPPYRQQVNTVDELTQVTEERLLGWRNLGWKTVLLVEVVLESEDLELRGGHPLLTGRRSFGEFAKGSWEYRRALGADVQGKGGPPGRTR